MRFKAQGVGTGGYRETKIQRYQKGELEKRGANVRVIRGWDAAKEFVNEVMPNEI